VQQEEVTTRTAPAARPCSVSPCRYCCPTVPGFDFSAWSLSIHACCRTPNRLWDDCG